MSKHHNIPVYLKIALLIGMLVNMKGAYAQTANEKDAQRLGKLSGLSYKLNTPATVANGLILSPNPASEELHVRLPDLKTLSTVTGCRISILNQYGRRVLDEPWDGGKVDVSWLEPGIYIVSVNKDRQTYTQKLVIDR